MLRYHFIGFSLCIVAGQNSLTRGLELESSLQCGTPDDEHDSHACELLDEGGEPALSLLQLYAQKVPRSSGVERAPAEAMNPLFQLHARNMPKSSKLEHTPAKARNNIQELAIPILNFSASNETAAAIVGVSTNRRGDLVSFLYGLALAFGAVFVFICWFSCQRTRVPLVYQNNVVTGEAPFEPSDSCFGWICSAWMVTAEQATSSSGLDASLLLQFEDLAMKMCISVGIPMIFIVGLLNYYFGGHAAAPDRLSALDLSNVAVGHPWLYYVHAVAVWAVCIIVSELCWKAQLSFVKQRKEWLREMPLPRASTVLVEGIPRTQAADAKVKDYLNSVFGGDAVMSAHVVKETAHLRYLLAAKENSKDQLYSAQKAFEMEGVRPTYTERHLDDRLTLQHEEHDAIDYWTKALETQEEEITDETKKVNKKTATPVPGSTFGFAFVTFRHRRDAVVAASVVFKPDDREYTMSPAPSPIDIIWRDFQIDLRLQWLKDPIGWILIFLLFWAYLPFIVAISSITSYANIEKVFPFMTKYSANIQPLWDAEAGTMALTLFLSFLPNFLSLIIDYWQAPRYRSNIQYRIQGLYFWFLVIYVLLVTAIGVSLFATLEDVVNHPRALLTILGNSMPSASHFYLNYLPLQWMSDWLQITRYMNLLKFWPASQLFGENRAKELCEPEDQDYYGIGGRGARQAFFLVLTIAFCTISPLITILGYIEALCARIVLGWLMVFAETHKPDMGGLFWNQMLHHVNQGMIVYILVMTGVLLQRASNTGPGGMAFCALAYQLWAYRSLMHLKWMHLPFEDVGRDKDWHKRLTLVDNVTYEQPELADQMETLTAAMTGAAVVKDKKLQRRASVQYNKAPSMVQEVPESARSN